MMRTGRSFHLWILLICLAAPAAAQVFRDDLGREVEMEHAPERLVSLVPSVTEIIFALDAGDRLQGVTDFCTYPQGARHKPQIGSYASPDTEAIVAARPDLVIASARMNTPGLIRHLSALGIAVHVVNPDSLSAVTDSIRRLGRVLHLPNAATRLADSMDESIAHIRRAARRQQTQPGVLFSIMTHPLVVAGPDTFSGELIELVGGRNLVPAGPSDYPSWNPESLLAANPEVIIATPNPQVPDPETYFAQWPELRAVANGRVHRINPDWIHRPGPRLIQGLEALYQILHGDQP